MVVQGITQFINGYVLNGKYGHEALVEDVRKRSMANASAKRGRFAYSFAYAPISDPNDYSIMRGEIVWDRLGDGRHVKVTEEAQQPYLRAALNGAAFLDSSGGTSLDDLEKSIRVFGFSRETVKFDGENVHTRPSGHPASTLVGRTTTYNTGVENIKPRDMVEWYLPQPGADVARHYKQIDDGVTKLSKERIGIAIRPMTLFSTLQEYFDMYPALRTAWSDFFRWDLGIAEDTFDGMLERGAFDPFMRALVQEIVVAYGDHACSALTGAPAGKRMDVLAAHPFANIRVSKDTTRTSSRPVAPRGPSTNPVPPQREEMEPHLSLAQSVSMELPSLPNSPVPSVSAASRVETPVTAPPPVEQPVRPSKPTMIKGTKVIDHSNAAKKAKMLSEAAMAERDKLTPSGANEYFTEPVNASRAFGPYPTAPKGYDMIARTIDPNLTVEHLKKLVADRNADAVTSIVLLASDYISIKSQIYAIQEVKIKDSNQTPEQRRYSNELLEIRQGLLYFRSIVAYEIVYRAFGKPFNDPDVQAYADTRDPSKLIKPLQPENNTHTYIEPDLIVECIRYLKASADGYKEFSVM